MKNQNIIIGLVFLVVASALVLWLGLTRVDPRTAEWPGLIFITMAVFLFLWALLGTLLLVSRAWRKRIVPAVLALRQAAFVSIAIVVALYLARFNLLTWLNVIIMLAILVFLEIFFMGKEEVR